MSRLSEFERAAESLHRQATGIARELRRGSHADFPELSELAAELARRADRLAQALSEFDAVLGNAVASRARGIDGDLLQALSPSRRKAAGGA